jgi:carotenoid 1,2-hydratase
LPSDGYAWWYFDAVSDDGERALSAIFFVGSVFSPSWAKRLRRGETARAEEHVAVNLALYERGKKRAWVMSEYGKSALACTDDAGPRIGKSAIVGNGKGLHVDVVERSAPFLVTLAGLGARVEGHIEFEPHAPPLPPVELGGDAEAHRWHVLMPRARVRVEFARPKFSFEGVGYHDVNSGDGRLERAFSSWSWARFHDRERTTIIYATHGRKGTSRAFVVDAHDDEVAHVLPATLLPEGEHRRAPFGLVMPRWFAVDVGGRALTCRVERLLEAAPFYARYDARLDAGATQASGIGEYLDLDRFVRPGVQFLLRFKMREQGSSFR